MKQDKNGTKHVKRKCTFHFLELRINNTKYAMIIMPSKGKTWNKSKLIESQAYNGLNKWVYNLCV